MIGVSCKLNDKFARTFLTLSSEKLVYSTRQHWIALFPLVVLSATLIFLSLISAVFASVFFTEYTFTFILVEIVFVSFVLELLIKQVVEWYFHFYIVTNHKIVEVSYRPLFSRQLNEILLDQVRCTEVDVVTRGFFSEMLGIGDVIITFDRPTHEEVFTLEKIKDPRSAAMYLADSFEIDVRPQENKQNTRIWVKESLNDKPNYRSYENLYPEGGGQ